MTEREYEPDPDAPAAKRRDIYVEHATDTTRAAPDDTARDIYQERVSGPAGEQVVHSEHVSIPSDAARRASGVARSKQIIYFIFGAIEALLAIRFILLALGANETSGFVRLIYGLS